MSTESEDNIPPEARDFKAPDESKEQSMEQIASAEEVERRMESARQWARMRFPSDEESGTSTSDLLDNSPEEVAKRHQRYETRLAEYLGAAEELLQKEEKLLQDYDAGEPGVTLVLDAQRQRIYFDDRINQDVLDNEKKYPDLCIRFTPENRAKIVRIIAQEMLRRKSPDISLIPPASSIDRKRAA